jgi:glucose-1-phosphate adenylyltransferase
MQLPGAKFVESAWADDAIVCAGSIVSGATVSSSVLGTNVFVADKAVVNRSVIMDNVRIGRGARVGNAIIDKNIVVPDGYQIGVDHEADRAAGFTVTDEGITVLGKGQPIAGTYTGPT